MIILKEKKRLSFGKLKKEIKKVPLLERKEIEKFLREKKVKRKTKRLYLRREERYILSPEELLNYKKGLRNEI